MSGDNKDLKQTVFGEFAGAFGNPELYNALEESGFFGSVEKATAATNPADTATKPGKTVPRPA